MIVSHRHRFVFLHIPKTAGTSICVGLGLRSGETGGWVKDSCVIVGRTKHHIVPQEIPENYFVFTFVRNPWDRILSYYMFRNDPRNADRKSIHPKERKISFKKWLQQLDKFKKYRRINRAFSIAISQQADIIENFAAYVGRYEFLERDIQFICKKVGMTTPVLQIVNSSTKKTRPYGEYYDAESRDIVAQMYNKDIELFDYKFGV